MTSLPGVVHTIFGHPSIVNRTNCCVWFIVIPYLDIHTHTHTHSEISLSQHVLYWFKPAPIVSYRVLVLNISRLYLKPTCESAIVNYHSLY